nr:tetratricopeptide repeat protein [Actinomycetota bacterium]
MAAAAADLGDAHAALADHDWARAHEIAGALAADRPTDPDVLVALAEALWWLGRIDECIAARERAFEAFEERGDFRAAIHVAARVFDDHNFKARPAIAQAWLR